MAAASGIVLTGRRGSVPGGRRGASWRRTMPCENWLVFGSEWGVSLDEIADELAERKSAAHSA